MSKQLWVWMTNSDGSAPPFKVPLNPGVVELHESKGFVRTDSPPFQIPKGRPRRADGVRSQREAARALAGHVWPSTELQFAVGAANQQVIELYCEGSKAKPHDRQVLLTVGRKLDKPGIYLISRSAASPRFESEPHDDGFMYGPDRTIKVDPETVRCPRCTLKPRDLTSENLNYLADRIAEVSGGKAVRIPIEYRKFAVEIAERGARATHAKLTSSKTR